MTLFRTLTTLRKSSFKLSKLKMAWSLGLLSMSTWATLGVIETGMGRATSKVMAAPVSPVALNEVRSLNGSGNNLLNPDFGKFGQALDRRGNANYSDGLAALSGGPNPRTISNQVFDQSGSILNRRGLSDFNWAWGQFLSHDISHTLAPHHEFALIPIPDGDRFFRPGQSIPMTRSAHDPTTGITTPRQQISNITPWIDGGNVYGGRANEAYGSPSDRENWLRTGANGQLETSTVGGLSYLPVASQKADAPEMDGGAFGIADDKRFIAGDVRANENAVLTSLHTLMVREHNRVADKLSVDHASVLSTLSPEAQDEFLYQGAKKVVGAQIQAVTYNEYLPALGITLGDYMGYNKSVDPTVMNEFSTAAFRLGHSQISGLIHRLSADGTTHAAGNLNLFQGFFDPDAFAQTDIDSIFRGLASNVQQETDAKITNDLRSLLFGPPSAGPILNGTDLASLNILRSRDHGLGTYNQTRVAYGLSALTRFDEVTSDVTAQMALASVYDSVDEIDLWVGMLIEDHLPEASVGELVNVAWVDQFGRLRDGDRFWYANDSDFQSGGALAKAGFDTAYFDGFTLAQLIANNTAIDPSRLGRNGNVFFAAKHNGAQSVPEPVSVLGMVVMVGGLVTRKRQPKN